jgi:hypothetical protein
MSKNKWYNKKMSKFLSTENTNNESTGAPVKDEKNKNEELLNGESNLDVNLIIAIFQEKLNSLMTELIIKEATIKQQANIIKKIRG